MNYCPNCGNQISYADRYCGACGHCLSCDTPDLKAGSVPVRSCTKSKPGAFSFTGRARRVEYWMLLPAVAAFCISAIALGVSWEGQGSEALLAYLGLSAIFGIPLLIWVYAVQVRRCHDLGWSGWILLIELVPYVGWVASLFFFCAFAFVDGQPGPNRFGPDPKGRTVPWNP